MSIEQQNTTPTLHFEHPSPAEALASGSWATAGQKRQRTKTAEGASPTDPAKDKALITRVAKGVDPIIRSTLCDLEVSNEAIVPCKKPNRKKRGVDPSLLTRLASIEDATRRKAATQCINQDHLRSFARQKKVPFDRKAQQPELCEAIVDWRSNPNKEAVLLLLP